MKRTWFAWLLPAVLSMTAALPSPAPGDEPPVKEGGWIKSKDDQLKVIVHTMEMTLHPQPEPRPALKYRLLPDEFEMRDGNAAVYYLKAGGFFEQHSSLERLREVYREAAEQAKRENRSSNELPPHSWLSASPAELPVAQVKEFLALTSVQIPMLAEASQRRRLDLDRQIRDVESPLSYLLPEIQSMREIARMQSLRCKVAIAEGDVDRAIEILGQQYALARHLGQDDFFVSNLVGLAFTWIARDDALYLVQHPDAPNLYWAIASMPQPLVDIRRSMSLEKRLLYLQFKTLREVDETPRTVGYWQDFLDRLILEFAGLENEFGLASVSEAPETLRVQLIAYIAAAYPAAKRYLIDICGLPPEQVDAYPIAQVVLLAVVRYWDEASDDYFKWTHLPSWQAEAAIGHLRFEEIFERAGLIAAPVQILLPAVHAAQASVARSQQALALIQTVEAIRMYGAQHGGRLPKTLDDLPVPAPLDPLSGKPFEYGYHTDHAVLTGERFPGHQYRLVLRFAE
jgi:hypothetical protein